MTRMPFQEGMEPCHCWSINKNPDHSCLQGWRSRGHAHHRNMTWYHAETHSFWYHSRCQKVTGQKFVMTLETENFRQSHEGLRPGFTDASTVSHLFFRWCGEEQNMFGREIKRNHAAVERLGRVCTTACLEFNKKLSRIDFADGYIHSGLNRSEDYFY